MIGICTPYKIANYGTKLQAYAVQNKINELGYDNEIINFDRKSDLRINRLFSRYCNYDFISSKFKRKTKNENIEYSQNIKIRNDAINSFDKTHYKTTKQIKGYKNLVNYSKKYDVLICGSDQIWLPSTINNPTTTLEFGSKDTKKISFAPSFGVSTIPKNKKNKYRRMLNNLNYISVRETTGLDIIKSLVNKEAKVVLDPTLTVNKKVWDDLINESRITIKDKYIFCYFLGTNETHRERVYEIAKENNLKIVTLANFKQFNECDEKLTDIQLYDVTPCDFISLIKNAEIVCTDSFHSTVFSIIYHRDFYVFERFNNNDKKSANSRIHSLLGLLGLDNKIVSSEDNYNINFNNIDYDDVDKKLNKLRKETDEFLINALNGIEKKESKKNTFEPNVESNCCGCGACKSVCPNKCIEMITDKKGFHYPKLCHPEKCIGCNLCNSVCPNKKKKNLCHSIDKAFYIYNKNRKIREQSSSGGVFYQIAKYIIDNKGYVCGAAYDDSFNVKHKIIDSEDKLIELVGSKYSESDLSDVFEKIKNYLDNKKLVLFSGTPCQVRGLKDFLKKEYDNLTTIDLLCYGIQSPYVWNKYKEYINKERKKINKINMRDKSVSWQNYSMKIEFEDGEIYCKDKNSDPYLRSYSKGLFIRPSCYDCLLKGFPRQSDITIGDYWDVDKVDPKINDQKGIGIMFINSLKGQQILDLVNNQRIYELGVIDSKKLKQYHPLFCTNAKKSKNSDKFYRLLDSGKNIEFAVKKCEQKKIKKEAKKIYKKIFKG